MNTNLNQVMEQLTQQTTQQEMSVTIILIVFGLLSVFFGYRLMKVWIAFIGFVVGALIGAGICIALGGSGWVVLLVGVLVGIVLAIVAFALYEVGVFIYMAFISFVGFTNLLGSFVENKTAWWIIALGVIVAILAGVLAVKFVRPVIIVITSISGALMAMTNFGPVIHLNNIIVILVAAAILAILGMVWQFKGFGHVEE